MPQTLHVTIERPDRSDIEETLGAIDAGEDVEPKRVAIVSANMYSQTIWPEMYPRHNL